MAYAAGASWTSQKIDEHEPFFDQGNLLAGSCNSAGFCAVVGLRGRIETTSSPTGASNAWTPADLGSAGLDGISCPTASLCVAVNESTGEVTASTDPTGGSSAWRTVATSSAGGMRGVSCYDASHCVAVGIGGEILTSATPATAGSWSATRVDSENSLSAVSCPAASGCVAVDVMGNAVTSTNALSATPMWSVHPADTHQLNAVACPDTTLCVAVDDHGGIAISTNEGTSWSAHADVDTASGSEIELNGVSCQSDSLCVAVDQGGRALVSQNPTAATPTWSIATVYNNSGATTLSAVICTTQPLCMAVDAAGNELTSTNPAGGTSTWSKTPVDGTTRLDQGSCPSLTLCVVPDRFGRVLTSTNPTGGAGTWTAKSIDGTHQIFALACPSTSLCVGVDDAGNVLTSTNPSAGASATWSAGSVDSGSGEGLHAVSCPSTSLCVAVSPNGSLVTSTNPTAGAGSWSASVAITPSVALFAIDCPTTTLCVAVDETGKVVTATDPTGGSSAWTVSDIDGGTSIYSVSCPEAGLCLAGDSHGNVLSSTNPAGGASAWSAPVNVASSNEIFGLACLTIDFCLVADSSGNIFSATDPTGEFSAWSYMTSSGDSFGASGAECAGTSLCVLSNYQSDVAVGSLAGPTATTGTPAALTPTTGTLNGNVNPNATDVADCRFEYGTSTAYGTTVPCVESAGNGTSAVNVHADVSGLVAGTTYHVRLEASSASGPGQGTDVTFTAPALSPTVSAGAATSATARGAVLNGAVKPNGFAVTDCHFEYGTTTSYGTSVPCDQTVGGGSTSVPVTATLGGLTANTTYDFELVATNSGGTSRATGTFATAAIDTTITSGPNGPTNIAAPRFTFTADPSDGATFLCAIDGGAKTACASPYTTGHLADGSHTISVRAIAPGGAQDPTPATQQFFVDTVAPQTTLQVLGGQRSGSNIHGMVILGAEGADPIPSGGGVRTHCELLTATAPPPASFAAMPDCTVLTEGTSGNYVLYGASADAAGNVEPVRSTAFVLQSTVDVSITSGVFGNTWEKEPQFAFTSHTAGASFLCRIDNSAYTSCQSPWLSPAQDPGPHVFHVRSVAPDGTQSDDLTDYYTINAPQTVSPAHCAVDPFVLDPTNPNGSRIIGCGFGSCPKHIACSPALTPCPAGAVCTLKFNVQIADADPAVTFQLYDLCQQSKDCTIDELDDAWIIEYSVGVTGPPGVTCAATANADPIGCSTVGNSTFLGSGRATTQYCLMRLDDGGGDSVPAGDTQARDFGPDSSRHIDCDDSESIAPASPLDIAGVSGRADTADLFAPAAGLLTLRGALTGATDARAKKPPPKPGFTTIKLTVKHPGVVRIRFRFNAAAKQRLTGRHKIAFRVKVALAVPHQTVITKVHTITFNQPPKPQSKREREARARKLCLRKHPRGRKLCDRL